MNANANANASATGTRSAVKKDVQLMIREGVVSVNITRYNID